jgi:hypothetical protein
MTRYLKVAALTLLALLVFAPLASARPGGFGFGGGFRSEPLFAYGPSFYYGPGWYGPGWGWYGYGYGPGWYGPGWYEPYGYVPTAIAGKVKVDIKAKDTEVFVDGGYAGTVKELRTFPLKAGAHDIELRHPNGQSFYQGHIDVIAGKTIDIKP